MNDTTKRCGYIGIVGKPNVGKSTLTNCLLGQKLCITARRPQTTRHQVMGIKSTESAQLIFIDTPGIHQSRDVSRLNQYINQQAISILHDVDVLVWLLGGTQFTDEDEAILKRLQHVNAPIIVAINKMDLIKDKTILLPFLDSLQKKLPHAELIPISATKNRGLDDLEKTITRLLPEQDFIYGEDEITNRPLRFVAEEFIREKCIRHLGQELPYKLTVKIETFEEQEKITRILATIYVEKPGHKSIVIGDGGAKIKEISQSARISLEKLLDKKVFLELWVKVKANWTDTANLLSEFGLD